MKRMLLVVMVCALPVPVGAQDSERLYREACDAGDLLACNVFGLMYEAGEGGHPRGGPPGRASSRSTSTAS